MSFTQYTVAKIVSAVGMFLVPWLTLLLAAFLAIETRNVAPRGSFPLMLILATPPFVVFSLILATALVTESEAWVIAANVVCSSSYWFIWYLLSRVPELSVNANGKTADWNSTVLMILLGEAVSIAALIALTLFLQSRKRDFVWQF